MGLFAQLALALHHIHSHSILHRDLKPSNIFVAGDGADMILKIGDFGISRALTKKSKAESVRLFQLRACIVWYSFKCV